MKSLTEARRAPLLLSGGVLLALALACSLTGTPAPEESVSQAQTLPPTWTATVPMAAASPTPEATPAPEITPGGLPADVCDLVPAERVEFVMGEAVAETVPGEDLCMQVLPSGSSVTAMIQRGDAARNGFIDSIAQLSTQEGCVLTASYESGAAGEPTPLPAEVAALVAGKSLLELVDTFLEIYAAHCDSPLETVAGYGDRAFFQPLDMGFLETMTLGVVVGDDFVLYTLALLDPMSDPASAVLPPAQAQEWLMSLAQAVSRPAP